MTWIWYVLPVYEQLSALLMWAEFRFFHNPTTLKNDMRLGLPKAVTMGSNFFAHHVQISLVKKIILDIALSMKHLKCHMPSTGW